MKKHNIIVISALLLSTPMQNSIAAKSQADYKIEAQKIYEMLKPHDSKLRNVSITDNTMVLYRARQSKVGQNEQAESWCADFSQFKYIQVRSAINNEFLGGVSCH